MELLDDKVIHQLVRDIGVENAREFIAALDEEFLSRCQNIRSAREEDSLDRLRREAHAFKGAALTYGASALGELLYQIERQARAADIQAFSLIGEVLTCTEKTLLAYQNLDLDQYA